MTIKATELINVHKGLKRKINSMQAEIDELKVLLEAKDHVIDCAIDLVEKTVLEGFYATSDVYVDFRDALKPFMV